MLELFSNPGYLVAGGALVSAPIIIHLINRMRFRRVRWAAMEFLLKSQKRNRRRLIIEQLLLLALRCLLVLLVAILVSRFIGLSLAGFVRQDGFHVVLVDDTLSMKDRHKENGVDKNAFQTAIEDIVLGKIYTNVAQSTTNERLTIIPLSKLLADPEFEPKVYEKLGDTTTKAELEADVKQMKPSNLRVELLKGIQKAKAIFNDHPQKRHVFYIVSDFRRRDWTGPEANQLIETLRELQDKKDKKVSVWPLDAAHPHRISDQGSQLSHDNVGIVDFRPNTRVVGKGMPVTFTVTVANYSPNEKVVNVVIYDDLTGKEMAQVDFLPPMPMKIPAGNTATASFELRLYPPIKGKNEYHAQKLSAHLETAQRTPLEDDGLPDDNVRYASVEVREKVPILVVDGEGSRGLEENQDSFFIEKAITSVPGASYEVVHAHQISGGKPAKVLERPDLSKFPTIFILNLRELTAKQQANLDNFVREGGGVAFFMGKNVSGNYYTKNLYRNGKGLFPAPIKDTYTPPLGQSKLKPKFTGDPQLLLRHDQFGPNEEYPIFGPIFSEELQPLVLQDFPVFRYFEVPRSDWIKEPGKVFELATLPNNKPAIDFRKAVLNISDRLPTDNEEYKEFWPALKRHKNVLRRVVEPGSDFKAYQLAGVLKRMLNDTGRKKDEDYPDLQQRFWTKPDREIRSLKRDVEALAESTQYGDPFVVARKFGKGRVVAVMSTAGKEWSHFAGGSLADCIYPLFIWEMQNWLSSQTSESNLLVGSPVSFTVDLNRFKEKGVNQAMMVRSYYRAEPGKQIEIVKDAPSFGTPGKEKGIVNFTFDRNFRPGFYLFEVFAENGEGLPPLYQYGRVFNVDTVNEGKLQRVTQHELNQGAAQGKGEEGGLPEIRSADAELTGVINRQTDWSEFPLLFLIFIIVLVCEQALAVHLSFHLRASEGLPAQAAPARARAA